MTRGAYVHAGVLALLFGLGLLAVGLLKGEGAQVLLRGTEICLECMGLR